MKLACIGLSLLMFADVCAAVCRDNARECSGGGMCIPVDWWCDKNEDCPNGEDEAACSPSGQQGPPGPPGPRGPRGPIGPTGSTGPIGPRGTYGSQGPEGVTGAEGSTGDTGARGFPGIPGSRGVPGTTGHTGAPGVPGTTGGAIYTRWGNTSCPSGAALIYDGFAGGSMFSEKGSASNILCLPGNPTWNNYSDTNDDPFVAHMYGAEYEIGEGNPRNKDLFGPGTSQKLNNYDVPCAVCRSTQRAHVLMIPAKKECFAGLHLEYSGYLMAQRFELSRTEYVCVDGTPNLYPGSIRNDNGALFYFVEARCGSLPCPPYVNYRELACVVCTI